MTRSKHPAIDRFPAHADRIAELIRRHEEFAGICRDYAEIVDDIARQESKPGQTGAGLADLIQLRADLERDMAEWLSDTDGDVAVNDGPSRKA